MRRNIAICLTLAGTLLFVTPAEANSNLEEESIVQEISLSESIIQTAHDLLGVKYRTAGSSPSTGFDCSGYTNYVFAQHDITLPRSSSSMYEVGQTVDRSELQPGDLVFFNTSGSAISHVGIYIGDSQFIHSESGKGITVTSLNDPYYWSKRYVGAKRVL